MTRPIDPPRFAGSGDRPRVLIEAAEWAARELIEMTIRDAGFDVARCAGPAGTDQRCALAADGACTAAGEADVVIHALRPQDERNREVLASLRRLHPGLPIVVEVPEPLAVQAAADFEGCEVIYTPMSAADLRSTIDRALGSGRGD